LPVLAAPLRAADEEEGLLRSDSQAPYVHRIALYDHDGGVISPEDEPALPYSPRMTCGKCHDYGTISRGWHFNAPLRGVEPGRRGEPWFLVEPRSGTVLPVSGRAWAGAYTPEEVGLTNWQFVQRFGRHTPGGGFGEPRGSTLPDSPMQMRWGVSGKLEVDCMVCHSADQQHDPAEAAAQIEKENFRWVPTVALGLAVVRGEARKAPDEWDPLVPPDPDFPERAGPQLIWDRSRFDPDDRVLFNIVRQPPNERCYFCHSFRVVGSGALPETQTTQDVHVAAGLKCADCHRNGLDHMIVRGYRTEAQERGEPEIAVFSCEGCHLGVGGGQGAETVLGGRYGARHPQHRGLPPVHFEELTCTACHSGPWPEMDAKRFQTALAHGLGLASQERDDDMLPRIVGPVFARQHDGRIAPQRLVWPCFVGLLSDSGVRPLPWIVTEGASELLDRTSLTLDEQDIGEFLRHLDALMWGTEPPLHEDPVCVRGGRLYQLNAAGDLETTEHPAAAPYRWSIGHNVRPAAQSLGVKDCTDCHADGAPIYFGRIADADDPEADGRPVRLMHELRGDDAVFARMWNLGFTFRPAFKWFGFACVGVLGLVLLHYVLAGVGAIARRFR
jgi:hypothetical protein